MEYIDRFKRRSTLHGTTNKERYLNQTKDNFNKYLSQAPNKYSAQVRNNLIDLTIIDMSEINKDGDAKYFLTKINEDIIVGDIVVLQDTDGNMPITWLLTDKEGLSVPSHKKFKAVPTNYLLKYINNDIIYESPIIKTYQTLYGIGLETDKYLTTGNAKLSVLISDNENTRKLTRGSRFIIDNKVWKVTNDELHDGYLKFTCEEDEQSEYDDMDLKVADYWSEANPKPIYTFTHSPLLIFDKFTEVKLGSSDFEVRDNGVLIANPQLIITSTSPIFVLSYGKLLCNATGTGTINIKFTGRDGIDYINTIPVQVIQPTVVTSTTYELLGDINVKRYCTNDYEVVRKINGYVDNCAFTITLDKNGNEGKCELNILDTRRFEIRNISGYSGETIIVKCVDNESGRISNFNINLIK